MEQAQMTQPDKLVVEDAGGIPFTDIRAYEGITGRTGAYRTRRGWFGKAILQYLRKQERFSSAADKVGDLTGCQREWLDPELKGAEDKRRKLEADRESSMADNDEMKPSREAFEKWWHSDDRPPLEDFTSGDVATSFQAGWQAAHQHKLPADIQHYLLQMSAMEINPPSNPIEEAHNAGIEKCKVILRVDNGLRRNYADRQRAIEVMAKAMSQWMNCKKLPQCPNWERLQKETQQAYLDQAALAYDALLAMEGLNEAFRLNQLKADAAKDSKPE